MDTIMGLDGRVKPKTTMTTLKKAPNRLRILDRAREAAASIRRHRAAIQLGVAIAVAAAAGVQFTFEQLTPGTALVAICPAESSGWDILSGIRLANPHA